MRLRLVRHATLIVEIGERRLLVDPLLSDAGVLPPMEGSGDDRPNPLVPLPIPAEEVVRGIDAVLLTHLHTDHLDPAALDALPPAVPMLCGPDHAQALTDQGLTDVRAIDETGAFGEVRLSRAGARHGTGAMAEQMGPVDGWTLSAGTESTLYLTGDTVFVDEVRDALSRHRPDVVVANAGRAEFLEGGPITMTDDDIVALAAAASPARVVAVHMEAINHCRLERAELRERLRAEGLTDRVVVPEDGDVLSF
jgi:L-ascorbate metabolism protein UlaG (beta-lactamase superfamily)